MKLNIKMVLRYLLCNLAFWATWFVPLTAIIAADEIKSSSQDALVIAISSNYPPFTQEDITGNPAGMFVDIWKLWSKKTGHKISFRISNWVGTLSALKNGEADIHSGLFYSETRDQWMDYSRTFYINKSSFYHRIDDTATPLSPDMKGMKIGSVKGYLQETFLKGAYPKAIVEVFANDVELIKALASGKIDLFLSEDPTIESLLAQTGMMGRVGSVGAPLLKNELYASVLQGRTDLLQKINAGFEQITPKEWAELEARWVKDPAKRIFGKDVGKAVELTIQEKAWVAANSVIRTIALKDWPPVDFQDASGEHTGIAADILDLAAGRVGLKVKPQFGPWPEMLSKLQQGQIDLAPEIYFTEERAKTLVYSRPFLPLHNALFVGPQGKDIKELADLTGRKVAVEKGYAMENFLKSAYPGINIAVVTSTLEALKTVSIGKADAYVGSQYVASYLIDQNLLQGVKAIAHLDDTPQFLHMAVPKNRKILRDIMDKALGSISEKEKRNIINRYVPTSLSSAEDKTAKTTIDLTVEERKWLRDHPVLRVAPDPDYPPIEFFDSKGRYQGLAADFMRLVTEKLGVRLEALKKENWTEVLEALRNGEVDFLSANTPIEEFNKEFIFTDTYYEFYDAIITHEGIKGSVRLEDLGGKEVLVAKDWPEEHILRKKYPDIKVVTVESTLEGVTKVAFKEYDYIFSYFPTASYLIREQALPGLRVANIVGEPVGDAAMFRKDSVILRNLIQKGLESITGEERRTIKSRWVPSVGKASQDPSQRISLTDEEKAWLKDHPVIRVHNETGSPPINFVEHDIPKGFSIDYMRLLAEKIGLNVEFTTGPSWDEFMAMIETDDLDVMLNIAKTPQREKFLSYTPSYLTLSQTLFTRNDFPLVSSIEDLYGKKMAVVKGFYIAELLQDYPEVAILEVQDIVEAMHAVSVGKADALYDVMPSVNYLSNKYQITNLKVGGDLGLEAGRPMPLHLAVSQKNAALAGILSKGMANITDDEFQELSKKWLGRTEAAKPVLDLTAEEQAYIKAHPQLSFGIDVAWPPFEFLDEEGKYSGISSGVTERVAKISGIKLEPEKELAWSKVLESLKSGRLKMVAMIKPTPERAEYLDFTEPYVSFPSVILTRDDAPFISGLGGLDNMRTGVGKGYAIEEYIRTNYPKIELVPERDVKIVLKELSEGKTDAAVMNLAVATYIIGKLNLDNIKIATPTEFKIDLAFGVQKGDTVLRDILQKSLNAITEDEMTAIKNRWVALRVNFGLDLKTILMWAVPIGGISLLIIIFVVIWNRRLGHEISERKKAQEQLTESEERTRLILTSAGEGIFGVNLTGKISFINEAACKMVGYSHEEIMGELVHDLIHHSRPDGSFYPVEECPMRHAFTEGLASRIDNEVLWRKDGTQFDVEYSAMPVRRNNDIIGAVISFQDITVRKKAQKERDDAYQVITSSIQYASRIQRSFLPPDGRLTSQTSDHFILWKPRDVVGGDIYWSKHWGDGELIILADCTGHGVPGAFMTLISSGALDMALLDVEVGNAASLIQRMHQIVQQLLSQDVDIYDKDHGSDDGLELGICYISQGRFKNAARAPA